MGAPKEIIDLVERFDRHLEAYKSGRYNETQLRREFIDPFFEALGWDVNNKSGYAEAYKEVIHEDSIKVGAGTKAPDYCFRVGGARKFFLEAKKPSVDIKNEISPAYQVRRYAWSAKLPLSILSDFEELAVYDCRVKPSKTDKSAAARAFLINFKDYIARWDEIAAIFSKEAIQKGSFDKFVESGKKRRGTTEVDAVFLKEIESWRETLAKDIAKHNPRLTQRERKAGGIYYTPSYIVDYIVKNTVGKLLEGKDPKLASTLKILDPACGSGHFLIGAYQYLLDWHLDWYVKDGAEKWALEKSPALYRDARGEWRLTTPERKRVLLNNIYGVDIDPQAVEVAKLSLLLKVLEGETGQTLNTTLRLFHERALPDLGANIKCGNSLIGPDFYENRQTGLFGDEERYRVNAFDWNKEFKGIMEAGGFDAVIGNPPYVKSRVKEKTKDIYRDYLNNSPNYISTHGMWDLYVPFVEKGVKLLSRNGHFGFIVPDTLEKADYTIKLKELLLKQYLVYQVDFFPESHIFRSGNKIIGVKNMILFVQNCTPGKTIKILHEKSYEAIKSQKIIKQNLKSFEIERQQMDLMKKPCLPLGEICYVSYGLRLNSVEGAKDKFKKEDLLADSYSRTFCKKYTEGKYLSRYCVKKHKYVEWGTKRSPGQLVRPTFPELYNPPKLLLGRQTKAGTYDPDGLIVDNTIIVCPLYKDLKGVQNRNIDKYFSNIDKNRGILEANSTRYNLKYILGILNSSLIKVYLNTLIRGTIDAFPDDWKKIPIRTTDKFDEIDKTHQDKIVASVERMLKFKKGWEEAKTPHEKESIQRQIEATDKQIDQLVYALYGLTPEEISIVEGNKNE